MNMYMSICFMHKTGKPLPLPSRVSSLYPLLLSIWLEMRRGHGSFCWPVCKVDFKEHEDGLSRFYVDCSSFLYSGKKNPNYFSTVKCNLNLKGNSTSSTLYSVLTGLGKYYYICEQSSIKPFVVAEEAACILINWLWWWTVGFCTFVFSEVLCRGWSCCFSHTFNQLIISPLPHTHAAHLTPFI